MAPTDPITVTRDELVAVHREWETRRRLRPSTFSDPRDEYGLDVDESAERSVDFVLELLEEIRSYWIHPAEDVQAGTVGASTPEPAPVTAASAAAKAATALEAGNIDVAAGWTNLVRALS